MTETMKQLNIRLPPDLHRKLKLKSVADDVPLVEVIEGLVRAYLAGKVKITRKTGDA